MIKFRNFLSTILLIFLGTAFLSGLLYRSYYIPDQPLFERNTLIDYVLLIILSFATIMLIYLFRNIGYKKGLYISIIISVISQVLFIVLYPLEPFSDMKEIHDIAININKFNYGAYYEKGQYLSIFPNNIYMALLLKGFYTLFTPHILVAKSINIFSSIIIIICSGRIYKELFGEKYIGSFFLLLSLFPPTILYSNHIYNDSISTALFILATLALIIGVRRSKNYIVILSFFILAMGDLIRQIGLVFLIAFVISLILKKGRTLPNLMLIIFGGTLFFFTKIFMSTIFIQLGLIASHYNQFSMPIYAWIYLGLNPMTLGFQDGGQSFELFYQVHQNKDIAVRLYKEGIQQRFFDNGLIGNISLVIKKFVWTWTEGTYQMERYGFGYGNKLEYSTFLSKLIEDNAILRSIINRIMHVYNLVLLALACVGLRRLNKNSDDLVIVLLLMISGILAFYIIWEIKSRYIFVIWPYMYILSFFGASCLIEKIELKKKGSKE